MIGDRSRRVATTRGTISVADLEARCSVVEPGVVLVREIPNNTAEAFEVLMECARELARPFERWAMIVDLTETTERPKGRYLEIIRSEIRRTGSVGTPFHTGAIRPSGAFLRTVTRFVIERMSPHVTIHGSRPSALAACRDALRAAEAQRDHS
jgi:hypothetical protein